MEEDAERDEMGLGAWRTVQQPAVVVPAAPRDRGAEHAGPARMAVPLHRSSETAVPASVTAYSSLLAAVSTSSSVLQHSIPSASTVALGDRSLFRKRRTRESEKNT